MLKNKVVLITGAARRLGAQTAETLHENGANIIIHYGQSETEARQLAARLNELRPNSVMTLQADFLKFDSVKNLARNAVNCFGRLDILINNASSFYPTPITDFTEAMYDDLMSTNFKAPLFLSQYCFASLKESQGCIINMLDTHARAPLKEHTIYSCAKAACSMLTRSLTQEMAPHVRINGIAPGAILWPETSTEEDIHNKSNQIPLKRPGNPQNIADTVLFLIQNDYINGQIINIDGGKQLF